MSYKLLVLDIDGTVTNSEKIITEKTRDAIIKAQQSGVIAVLASGRPTAGMRRYAQVLELKKYGGYLLSYNGGRIENCKTGEVIFEKIIKKSDAQVVYDAACEFGLNIISYNNNDVIAERMDKYCEIECKINQIECKLVDSLMNAIPDTVPKFLLLGDGDYLGKIESDIISRFGGKFNAFRSEPYFLEVMPKGIDKANSLSVLAEKLKLTRDDIIACGDGYNDISMISYAGLGVAMENAQIPVKEVCDFITLSNNHDGIAHVVEKFILKNNIA